MNKKIIEMLKSEKGKYNNNKAIVEKRRNEWSEFVKKTHTISEDIISEYKKDSFFSNLYIQQNSIKGLYEIRNFNSFALVFGQHPTGVVEIRNNFDNFKKEVINKIENGGCILYSQGVNGQVMCFIYGSKSELLKPKNEYFIYNVYNSPNDITENEFIKAVKVFLWYNRITSYIGNLSIINTFIIDYYKIKSFTYQPDWNAVFGVIGALGVLFGIVTTI